MLEQTNRTSAFIVLRCLEPPFKHDVQVFEVVSQSTMKIDILIASVVH